MIPFLYGLGGGWNNAVAGRAERIVRVGQEVSWACWLQCLLVWQVTQILPSALSRLTGSRVRFSNTIRFSMLMVPVVVGAAIELSRGRKGGSGVRNWFLPIHEQLGTAATALIGGSYFFTIGERPWESCGVLTSMAVSHWVHNAHDADPRARRLVHMTFLFLVAARGWLGPGRWEKVWSSFYLLIELLEFLPQRASPQLAEGDNGRIEEAEMTFVPPLRVDGSHFRTSFDLPPAPKVDLDRLVERFDEIDWDEPKAQRLLDGIVKGQSHSKMEKSSSYKVVREGLVRYVADIEKAPPRVAQLAYLLADLLPALEQEEQEVVLANLGVASYWCEQVWEDRSETLYRQYTGHGSIGERYLHELSKLREQLLLQLAGELQAAPDRPMKHTRWLGDMRRRHDSNSIIAAFGEELGLPTYSCERARRDPLANTSRLGQEWTRQIYGELLTRFWSTYNERLILDYTRGLLEKESHHLHHWFEQHWPKGRDTVEIDKTVFDEEGRLDPHFVRLFAWKAGALCPRMR